VQAASVAVSKNVARGYIYLPTNCSATEAPAGRFNRFKCGIDFSKYIHVSFVGEPAVDEGGPLREFCIS